MIRRLASALQFLPWRDPSHAYEQAVLGQQYCSSVPPPSPDVRQKPVPKWHPGQRAPPMINELVEIVVVEMVKPKIIADGEKIRVRCKC